MTSHTLADASRAREPRNSLGLTTQVARGAVDSEAPAVALAGRPIDGVERLKAGEKIP